MNKEKLRDEVWKLYRKADQTRSMHDFIQDRYIVKSNIILGYVSIGSAIAAMLIFASLSNEAQFLIGLLSSSIFIVGLIPLIFSFERHVLGRGLAVKQWGLWIRSASNFCNTEIDGIEISEAVLREKELVEQYKKIMDETPSIPDRLFNKLKQRHLQKVEVSKALDKKPFTEIKEIKEVLKKNSDAVKLGEGSNV